MQKYILMPIFWCRAKSFPFSTGPLIGITACLGYINHTHGVQQLRVLISLKWNDSVMTLSNLNAGSFWIFKNFLNNLTQLSCPHFYDNNFYLCVLCYGLEVTPGILVLETKFSKSRYLEVRPVGGGWVTRALLSWVDESTCELMGYWRRGPSELSLACLACLACDALCHVMR